MDYIILISLILIVIVAILLFVLKFTKAPSTYWKTKSRKTLQQYDKQASSKEYIVLKSTVIDTDKLLDHCLKYSGASGDTMADRLRSGKSYFSKQEYEHIWSAHKLRNKLVHEMSEIPEKDLKQGYFHLRSGIITLTS